MLQTRLQILNRSLLLLDDLREHGDDIHRRQSFAIGGGDEVRHVFSDEADASLDRFRFVRESHGLRDLEGVERCIAIELADILLHLAVGGIDPTAGDEAHTAGVMYMVY